MNWKLILRKMISPVGRWETLVCFDDKGRHGLHARKLNEDGTYEFRKPTAEEDAEYREWTAIK